MDKSKYISRIKTLLGSGTLNLEIDDNQISNLIDIAFDEIKPYITDTKLITKVYAQVIDLKDDNISDVVRVYPADETIYNQGRMFDFEGTKLDRSSIHKAILGTYPLIDSDIHFRFENNVLYLESDKVYTGSVTIEAMENPSIEDLKDERATNWIFSYSLALSKQVCGRIRSKYKSSNVPVEMDGDTLLSEAQQELAELKNELQERQFGPFMILR